MHQTEFILNIAICEFNNFCITASTTPETWIHIPRGRPCLTWFWLQQWEEGDNSSADWARLTGTTSWYCVGWVSKKLNFLVDTLGMGCGVVKTSKAEGWWRLKTDTNGGHLWLAPTVLSWGGGGPWNLTAAMVLDSQLQQRWMFCSLCVCVCLSGRKWWTWYSWLLFCPSAASVQQPFHKLVCHGRSYRLRLRSTEAQMIFCVLSRWRPLIKCGKHSKQNIVWDLSCS